VSPHRIAGTRGASVQPTDAVRIADGTFCAAHQGIAMVCSATILAFRLPGSRQRVGGAHDARPDNFN
jgi:hypothetical protein